MTPRDYLEAARVPDTVQPQKFGLWTIQRIDVPWLEDQTKVGWSDYTLLRRLSYRSLHRDGPGEVVMEDSQVELRKHLPIWLSARGRVLVTGLGLGCVVRGLLASPFVEHIDVIEIDRGILSVIGAEFASEQRVALHHGDALTLKIPGEWDYAWHDLWTDGDEHLQRLHVKLFARFRKQCRHQGAWDFPREIARILPWQPLGCPKVKQRRAA